MFRVLLQFVAFQKLLVVTVRNYRKGYRLPNNKLHCDVSCSEAFKVLDRCLVEQAKDVAKVSIDSTQSILSHFNAIKYSLPLSDALSATIDHTAFVLVQNISITMSSWNLNSLGRLLFMEIPCTKQVLNRSASIAYNASSPRVSFPNYSSLHGLECSSRKLCSSIHSTSMHIQVNKLNDLANQLRQSNLTLLLGHNRELV